VFINTPLTADENGVIFFGFRLQGTAPAPLGTNSSGFARIEPAGSAAYVLTTAAAGDPRASSEPHNCAPALSNDGATLYVVVFGGTTPYLLGLDSTNLATKYKVQLRDPRGHYPAVVWDDSTASPMVAPDGDVFFGVDATPYNGRGFMLHFSPDLQTLYPPGAFGFDNTASIVPAHLVPSYSGSSTYLLLTKYNNYVGGDGNGVNRMALLDPKATQIDPHPSADGLVEMREVLTVIGCTPDTAYRSSIAVREWCVNSVAVNPPTRSVFVPSEDGRIYRWDLAANSLAETLPLGPGVGEPYVPVVIGPDGTVYTLNGSTLSAVGSPTNVSFALYSSAPDVTRGVVGQPVTFTAVVREPEHRHATPSGSVTFQDVTYNGFVRVTNLLAAALPLSDGRASVTTSSLTAVSNYLGCHFITATYSGDATFPPGSITLVQKVHQYGTTTTLTSYPNPGSNSVTLEAKVVSNPPGGGIPTGQVAFWDHKTFLNQVPLTNGTAAFTTTDLAVGRHALTARYASDSYFAASSAGMSRTPPFLGWPTQLRDGTFQFGFSNSAGLPFTVLSSSDPTLPLSNWTELGPATETFPGQFQFIDPNATNNQQQFYRVRSR
jgi:hypothetical protein